MRTTSLLITLALLSACSDDPPAPQSSAPPPAAPAATAPAEKADMAAAEAAEPQVDPCDLSGHDMSKMTADMHQDLVEACERSKQ